MRIKGRIVLAAILCASSAGEPAAQGLHVVDVLPGPGVDYTCIQEAVNLATDGDAILVRAGLYAGFAIDGKGVSVVAEAGATVEVFEAVFKPAAAVRNLSPDQRVLLQGLSATNDSDFSLEIADCAGPVRIEDSTFRGVTAGVADSSSVTFVRCLSNGGSGSILGSAHHDGLSIQRSTVFAFDSQFFGADGIGGSSHLFACVNGQAAGAGVSLEDGHLFASGCDLRGGAGGDGNPPGGFFLAGKGSDGGDGLELVGATSVAELLDCTASAGPGGASGGSCGAGADGVALDAGPGTIVQHAGGARSVSGPSPLREGEAVSLTFRGESGDVAIGVVALDAPGLLIPGLIGPLIASPPTELHVLGTLPPSGEIAVPVVFPGLPAGDFLTVHVQIGAVSSAGAIYLGAPVALVVVDGQF